MNCPYCGADTRVTRTTQDATSRTISRERQCRENGAHRFVTTEQERISMADIAVHQSGSNAITPYSTDVLSNNLREVLLAKDRLREVRLIETIVDLVQRRLVRREVPMRRLTEKERHSLKRRAERASDADHAQQLLNLRMVVTDSALEEAVDVALAQSKETRMERVLYALAVRGRQGGAQHRGWKDADDALDWLLSVAPTLSHLSREVPKPKAERQVYVPVTQDLPRAVMKHSGVRADFDLGRFTRTVEKSLRGREDALIKAEGVVWGTLSRVAGPSVVRTAQLSVVALDLLRATDDIAYLRAAVRWKGLDKVTDIRDEIVALKTHPSDRIRFVPTNVPSMLP